MPSDDLHVDDETLALLALGEQAGTPDDAGHLTACPRCADEVASLRAVADLAREEGPAPTLIAPSPDVWDRVALELGLGERAHAAARAHDTTAPDAAPAGADDAPRLPEAPLPLPLAGVPADARAIDDVPDGRDGGTGAADDGATPAGGSPETVAPVVPLRPRVRGAWLAVAAAVGLVVGGAGATAWWRTATPDPETVLASAALEPLPGWSETGSAQVRTAADGTRTLVVDLDESPGVDGYLEVWLLRPDVSGLVSLGTLDGTSGTFALPAWVDLGEFPVVDVSDEPVDGDPAHSGVSVVRGALDV